MGINVIIETAECINIAGIVRARYSLPLHTRIYRCFGKLTGLPALIFDIPWCSFSRKISDSERQTIVNTLSAGDILLTSDKLFPLWQYAVGVLGSPRYSHTAIYEGENQVIEATTFHPSGNGVARTAVHDFLSGRKKVCVVRPAYPSEYNKNAMFAWLMQQIGKPYDYGFSCDDDCAMYCAKLVSKAMYAAGFKSVGAKRFLRRELYLPDTFTQSADMNVVYDKSETLPVKLMNSLPQLIALLLWLSGITPFWFVCLALLAAGWGQYKSKTDSNRPLSNLFHKIKPVGLSAAMMIALSLATVMHSCSKSKQGNEIPDETSSYWSDAYRQKGLNGKVKTLKSFDQNGKNYHLLEYDENGNLLKDHLCSVYYSAFYEGITMSYDSQNRLTEVIYGSNKNPMEEIAEFEYDGSHSAYIPTNIFSINDLRLQKGVSVIKYAPKGMFSLTLRCQSISGNRIVFEGNGGLLAGLMGLNFDVEIECERNYPAKMKFTGKGILEYTGAETIFDPDGIPEKTVLWQEDGKTLTAEFALINGFLLTTKSTVSDKPDCYEEWCYDEKGNLNYSRMSSGEAYRYTYLKYDTYDNWVERLPEVRRLGQTEWVSLPMETREFAYWN